MSKLKFILICICGTVFIFFTADFVQSRISGKFDFNSKKKQNNFFSSFKSQEKTEKSDQSAAKTQVLNKNLVSSVSGSASQPNTLRSPAGKPDRQDRMTEFMKQSSDGRWTIESPSDRQYSFFGSKTKKSLKTDEEVLGFASSLLEAGGFRHVSVGIDHQIKKNTEHEIINEFKQQIEGVEVYGSYVRLFRESGEQKVTDVILEVNEYAHVVDKINYSKQEAEEKLYEYYSRLNKNVSNSDCARRTYFVENDEAKISYVCLVEITGDLPQKIEAVVDAAELQVLFQKTLSIYN